MPEHSPQDAGAPRCRNYRVRVEDLGVGEGLAAEGFVFDAAFV
jgi:hypothetical protein